MIGRSGDVVCDPHRTRGGDKKREFSGLASKLMAMVCQWFGLKTTAMVSWFGLQNQGLRFGELGPQNHRDDFLVWASKPSGRRFVGLCLKIDG
jgi:hypothetical protein